MAFSTTPMMGGRRGYRSGAAPLAEINIVPLVDVVLVLLIIFMLTAHVMEFGMEVDVPKTKTVKDTAEILPVVNVSRDGKLYLIDKAANINELPELIAQKFKGAKAVYVRGDKDVPWEIMAQVFSALGEAKLDVRAVTQPEETVSPQKRTMSARADILDQSESLRRPLLGSVTFHAGIIAFLVIFGWWENRGRMQFGDPNAMGGSVGITPVNSIPLPHRSGAVNPVANDTESRVPARSKPEEKRKALKEEPDAIPLHSKKANKRLSDIVARSQKFRPLESDRPNQVYSTTGSAVSSPMYGGTAGVGGTGIGNSVFGDRLGWYAQLLTQALAGKWGVETARIPPGVTTSRRVLIAFEILRDGTIRNARVLESSGNQQVDFAAQRAVLTASPVRRLPEEFERNVANVECWFQLQR